jgi:hypothetical protein
LMEFRITSDEYYFNSKLKTQNSKLKIHLTPCVSSE